ncbi:uncharacterized protein BXZ73DRAFT_99173 [Epithele typhae]|uniref:uncharacterized protein n=1 Tax=Epithele typhae TaxID=378194 RepID=UPI002008337E|nr:uncharacterized protein BXZ73DRAFT_99173 [Epithele typhae]KAH9940175.1 hypothetical protein BXZ73DRAFT_99173 [Epithele typhae]
MKSGTFFAFAFAFAQHVVLRATCRPSRNMSSFAQHVVLRFHLGTVTMRLYASPTPYTTDPKNSRTAFQRPPLSPLESTLTLLGLGECLNSEPVP